MGKETVILAVSLVALLVAGYAVYTNNSGELASPAEINNYSKDFESIQTTLEQLDAKLQKLEADTTTKLLTIKVQVEELKENTSLQPVSIFGITLNQKVYSVDDTILVTAQGLAVEKPVKIDLISYSGELISSRIPYSDSTGNLFHLIHLPSFLSAGTYKVQASYNGQITFQSISISDSIVQTSDSQPTVVTQAFSVNLDKESYKPGEIIRISGFGQATESVSLKVKDPDGNITSAHSSSAFDGGYTMIYILSSDAENGDWKMTIKIADAEESIAFQVA